jgi:REP element-mobilizing transposase RayT
MGRLARVVASGIPHHVTQRGNRRQQPFFCEDDYREYISLMAEWCHQYAIKVWAYCLMTNHVHLAVLPGFEDSLRKGTGEAHRRYTRRLNFREGWRGHLWQGRFSSFPLDERFLFAVIRRKNNSVLCPPNSQVQFHLDELFMLVSILDGNQTFSINGDRFTPGISVSNSEVGLASLSIAAFFLRLVCTNGMISKTEVSASYRHISLKILGEFPKVLERVSFELGQQKNQFRISMQTPVQNPLMTIESFNRQFQVGEKEREAVKMGWEQEMGKTMFHVVNAYTRAAQFEGLSAEASYRL